MYFNNDETQTTFRNSALEAEECGDFLQIVVLFRITVLPPIIARPKLRR